MTLTCLAAVVRSAAVAAVGTVIAATALTGCGAEAPASAPPQRVDRVAAGEFVGEVPELNAFVAVVADAPAPGATDRGLRAYLCDGNGLGAWFPGRSGATARLAAVDGEGTLDVAVTPDGASGTISLADGRTAPFRAHPAHGPAGLFAVNVSAGGELRGSSTDGDRLQGRVGRSGANAGFDAEGTITAADGTAPFAVRLSSADPFTGRAVFLEDGRSRGRSTSKDASGRLAIWG